MSSGALRSAWEAAQSTPGAPDGGLRAAWQAAQTQPSHDFHAEYASGALAKRMAGANARDAANLKDEENAQPGYGERLATHVLNTAQGIPGVGAVERGAGAIGSRFTDHPMGDEESYNALSDATNQIPTALRVGERVAGGLAAAPVLPASPIKAGAVLGGADAALQADPNVGLKQRLLEGAGGAAIGGATGALTDKLITGARALRTPIAEKTVATLKNARGEAADAGYAAAKAQGNAIPASTAVQDLVNHPKIKPIIDNLKTTEQFANVDPTDPSVLDEVYQTLSDQRKAVQKGLDAVNPSGGNVKRVQLKEIRTLQSKVLDAMEQPGPGLPYMPGYRTAVNNYSDATAGINAVRRGQDALKSAIGQELPAGRNLDRTTTQALKDWAATATPDEIAKAKQGVLGATRQSASLPGRSFVPLRRASEKAPQLLRTLDPNDLGGILANLGLAGVNAPAANP